MSGNAQYSFRDARKFFPTKEFNLLPFRCKDLGDEWLVVNEVGEHMFLSWHDLERLVHGGIGPGEKLYQDLKGKHFIYDDGLSVPVRLLSTKLRTKKAHLQGFIKLHIFVVTLRCEHSCKYCQVSRVSEDREQFDMTPDIAERSLEFVFRSPARQIKIELQGGEPLLNFDIIRKIVELAESKASEAQKEVDFVITTNLALATREQLEFCRDHRISISTSLDGPAFIHNANRPRPGHDSHERTIAGIRLAREVIGPSAVSALMTVTALSLKYPEAIIDEYLEHGFESVFVRNLSPYGFASRTGKAIGYSIDEFLAFYMRALYHILDLNRNGVPIVETYAQILLTRMLTPFSTGYVDLQSPAGAGTSVAVYNYDGDVYPSDEARMLAAMGDRYFRMGNVLTDTFEQVFHGKLVSELIEKSNLESIPVCSDCAFQPWCGADPVFHYGTQGNIVPNIPKSDFHKKHEFLFRQLMKLYNSDSEVAQVFNRWIAA